MSEYTPILWMRRKTLPSKKTELYHVERSNNPGHDIHYFYTLCRKEIKDVNWDITENPKEEECCPQCLALVKSGEPPWW